MQVESCVIHLLYPFNEVGLSSEVGSTVPVQLPAPDNKHAPIWPDP